MPEQVIANCFVRRLLWQFCALWRGIFHLEGCFFSWTNLMEYDQWLPVFIDMWLRSKMTKANTTLPVGREGQHYCKSWDKRTLINLQEAAERLYFLPQCSGYSFLFAFLIKILLVLLFNQTGWQSIQPWVVPGLLTTEILHIIYTSGFQSEMEFAWAQVNGSGTYTLLRRL